MKVLSLVVHLPFGFKERLEHLQRLLKQKCLSDVIILAVDEYYENLAREVQDVDTE